MKYCFALISAVYLFVFGFLWSKNRELITKIANHFGYYPGRIKPLLPKQELSWLIDGNIPISLSHITNKKNSMSCLDTACVIHFLKKANPENIFELGTFDGQTTLNMAVNSNPQAKIYTLDLPRTMAQDVKLRLEQSDKSYIEKDESGVIFKGKPCEGKITQLFGDSAQYDFLPFYGKMNMVFVDASHSYEYVINDSSVALKLLRNGKGLIVWHDYSGSWDGVTKALNELYENNPDFKDLRHVDGTSFAYLLKNKNS